MWRARFEDFVRFESDLALCDPDGNDLDFENGKPMWNPRKTVCESGDFVEVHIRMDGCVDDYDEQNAAMWLRRFAAKNGVYHINVDFEVIHENGHRHRTQSRPPRRFPEAANVRVRRCRKTPRASGSSATSTGTNSMVRRETDSATAR